jgi:hypothetical protein
MQRSGTQGRVLFLGLSRRLPVALLYQVGLGVMGWTPDAERSFNRDWLAVTLFGLPC